MNIRSSVLALVVAVAGFAACSSSGSGRAATTTTTTTTSTSAAARAISVTTTTVVQREQVIPARAHYFVDGRAVDLVCRGHGRVPVVFQAGGRNPGKIWDQLIASLGDTVFTCVFDRPGVAYDRFLTTPPTEFLTPRVIEKTLVDTLHEAGVGPRVILVGHSAGGWDSIVFGADYPNLVAGAVLFDPAEPDLFHTESADRKEIHDLGFDIDATAKQVHDVKTWPDVPLVILSADPATQTTGWTAAQRAAWAAGARRYARLSPQGIRRVVPGANHYVYLTAPLYSLLVIDTMVRSTD